MVLAEKAISSTFGRIYADLITFENDLACISEAILLISESPGAIAELGAFSQVGAIASKLIVIINRPHYTSESFIKLGPVAFLENSHNDSILVYDWEYEKRNGTPVPKRSSLEACLPEIIRAIADKLRKNPRTELYNATNPSHTFVLGAAAAFVLRGARIGEIREALAGIGVIVGLGQLRRTLFCLEIFRWIIRDRIGSEDFFFPLFEELPLEPAYKPGSLRRDTVRWIADIASELKHKGDPRLDRFARWQSEIMK